PLKLVLPPPAQIHASIFCAVQPPSAGDSSVWAVRAAAVCLDRRRTRHISSTLAHHQRQLLLAQLAHGGARSIWLQRFHLNACGSGDGARNRATPAVAERSAIRD